MGEEFLRHFELLQPPEACAFDDPMDDVSNLGRHGSLFKVASEIQSRGHFPMQEIPQRRVTKLVPDRIRQCVGHRDLLVSSAFL
jgi:hypothetical protein